MDPRMLGGLALLGCPKPLRLRSDGLKTPATRPQGTRALERGRAGTRAS
jgi:hypothetical protein